MKILKRLSLLLILLFIVPSTVYADNADDIYNSITGVPGLGSYLMKCQPDDALVLSPVTTITDENLTDNYLGGVVNLPRLASDYYYVLNDSNVGLTETTYPSLRFTTRAIGTSVTLKVCNVETKEQVYSCTLNISNELTNGYDYYYAEGIPDTSENVLQGLIDEGDNVRYYDTSINLYPHSWHKDSIVMDSYVVKPNVDCSELSNIEYDKIDIDNECYVFQRKAVADKGNYLTSNVKEYLGNLNSGLRDGLLVGGTKIDKCTYNSNTGVCTTVTELSDSNKPLYYYIATSDDIFYGKINTEVVSSDTFTELSSNAPNLKWKSNITYKLDSGVDSEEAGFTAIPQSGYLDYGPVSYDAFWTRVTGADIKADWLRTGKYWFRHKSVEDNSGVNVFAETLIYSGCIAHLGTVSLEKAEATVTLNFYYQEPGSSGSWKKLGESIEVDASKLTESDLFNLPDLQYYSQNCWYTYATLESKFSIADVSKTENSSINLYGNYLYTGAMYTVTFYNDHTGADTVKEFQLDQKPLLPTDPTGNKGYVFKNWHIVSTKEEGSGIVYNPNNFVPEANRNYIFKTMWDVKGVIVKVLTNKANYYIGQEVDKSTLQVHVQDSADVNDTRILQATEYTITDALIDEPGVNQFIVTYTATGATKVCEVTGLEVKQTGITATYKGGDVEVGTVLDTSLFDVYMSYNTGESELLDDFSISPNTIDNAGKNTITISYGGFSTTVTVVGLDEESESESSEDVKLKSISALYTGPKLYTNTKVKASNLLVVAEYSDGTRKTISSTKFEFSPNKFSTAGKQYIKVTYGGKSSSCEVVVYDKSEENKTQSSTNTNSATDANNSNTTNSNSNYSNQTTSNTNTASNNSASTSNTSTSKGSSTENKNDSNNKTKSDKDSKDKGTSPGYLNAANILTNVMNKTDINGMNTVDIKKVLQDTASGAKSVNITLVNGNSGNDLTTEMLNILATKSLTLHVEMVSPSDKETTLAKWTVNGNNLSAARPSVNLNINFDVLNKESERLLHFSAIGNSFPEGCSLSVYPYVSTYESGELIRLYTCDIAKNNAHLIQTFTWNDVSNPVPIDLYSNTVFCMSNAGSAYSEGSSLLVESTGISVYDTVSENSISDTSNSSDTTSEDVDQSFWEEEEDTSKHNASDTAKKSKPSTIILIVAIALVLLSGVSGVLLLVLNRKK